MADEGITAYHGSPHDFDKFDTSKIGTGEGAQAYGHGLYFAESEPVAKSYRDTLSVKQNLNVPTTRMITDPISSQEMKAIKEANNAYSRTFKSYAQEDMKPKQFRSFHDFYNFRNEISDLDNAYQKKHGSKIMDQINNVKLKAKEKGMSDDQIQSFLNDMGYSDALTPHAKAYKEAMSEIAKNAGGHMYEVHIDAHPDHFLDWDKPLSEQSHIVSKIITPELVDQMNQFRAGYGLGKIKHDFSDINGEDLYSHLSQPISGVKGNDKAASEHLLSRGIQGIKYLDASSRREGEGTRNYVVFDHNRVNVKRKYAEGGEVTDPDVGALSEDVEGYSKGGSPDLDIVREHLKRTASPLSDDPSKVHKALSIAESLKVPQGNKAGVGSFYNLVSPYAVKDVKSTVTDIPGVTHLTPRDMSWEDLYREGKGGSFINVAGDRTNLGRLTHINDKPLAWPVDMHAGPKYMLEPNKGEVWANNPTHATGFKNIIARAAKKGPVYGIYSPMGAQSGDFSYHMFDALMAQIPSSGLTKEGADYFNDLVKKGLHRPADKRKEAIKLMEKWPGIENPKEASEFAAKLPGSHRSDMIKKLDSKVMKDFGMPDVGVTRVAITDPALRDLPGNMLGHRVVRFDPDKLVEGGKSFTHTSYPEPAIGEYVGDIPPVQRHYAAPDVTDEKIAKLVGKEGNLVVHPYSLDPLGRGTYRKAFEEQKQIQPINQRMLESVQQGLENQKLYGFARGGEADISHALELARKAGEPRGDTILAHINPQEAAMLKRMGGSGRINPMTGLPQFSVDGNGPEAGSTGSAAGNSYGGSDNSSSDTSSNSSDSRGNGNNEAPTSSGGGGGNGGNSPSDSNVGNIGIGSMVAFGNPAMSSTFGKEDQGVSRDEQLAKDFASLSAAFLGGMPGSDLAKDYVKSATGNSPMADPFVGSSNPEANRVIAPEASPTMQVPAGFTNKQISAMMRETPAPADAATTPVQAAAATQPSLSDVMGTTPQGNYLFSGMDVATQTVPNAYTVNPSTMVQQVRSEWPTMTKGYSDQQIIDAARSNLPQGLTASGNNVYGDINNPDVLSSLSYYGIKPSSFSPMTQTNATTNWGAPAQMASQDVSSTSAPQGFADMYGVSPSTPEAAPQTQYAQPSFPHTETPSSAYAQQNAPTGNGNGGQAPQQVAANFPQSQSGGRGPDAVPQGAKKPKYWLNPATGKVELVPENAVMARGGRTGNDWESMIRHALDVAFRYGS